MTEIWRAAGRGSRLQMQIAVNRHQDELEAALPRVFPELREREAAFRWVSPLAPDFEEYRDEESLAVLGLGHLAPELRRFWPVRGPVWDGLALVELPYGPPGVLLAEAKSYPEEFYSTGLHARSRRSHERVREAIAATQRWLGAEPQPDRWIEPVRGRRGSSLYQTANRFAHLYFLRELAGVETWLAHVLFVDDTTRVATSRIRWELALAQMEDELGLARARMRWAGHVYLPARPASDLA